MAKELRKSRGEELFDVAVREVFDAVAELRTDQSTEWTEELKESLMGFADIIAEPTDQPPEREFDFEINLESDEPPKERTYRLSPAELQEKLELLNNWSEDEADFEINSVLFAMESRLHADNKFYDEIKTAYDSDEYLKSRKALPSWLVRHSNGLLYAYGSRLYVQNVADLR
eukprot:jgi/Tetstr1/437377/TSEL_026061.t1